MVWAFAAIIVVGGIYLLKRMDKVQQINEAVDRGLSVNTDAVRRQLKVEMETAEAAQSLRQLARQGLITEEEFADKYGVVFAKYMEEKLKSDQWLSDEELQQHLEDVKMLRKAWKFE